MFLCKHHLQGAHYLSLLNLLLLTSVKIHRCGYCGVGVAALNTINLH